MFEELLLFLLKHNEIAIVFYKVLYLSIIGSIVGLIVLLFRNLFKNQISGKWKCVFWIICLVSLVIPFRYEIKASIDTKVNSFVKNVSFIENVKDIPKKNITIDNESIISDVDNIDNSIENNPNDFSNNEIVENNNKKVTINFSKILLICIVPYIWFVGVFYFVGNIIYGYVRLKNKINRCNDIIVTDILKQSRLNLNVKKHVNLYYYNEKIVPSIFGIISPKILISKDILLKSDEELKYIFMHELAHYKRCDLIFNFILLMILSIHFYNPIIWIIYKAIREDIELAADELVIKKLNKEQSKKYGLTLLSFLNISKTEYKASFLCLSDTEKNMERRIKMIKKPIKNNVIGIVIVLIISLLIGVVVFLKFESKETIVDKIEDEVTNLSKEYEPIWQEPKKVATYEEYLETIKQDSYDGPKKVSAEERKNLISEEDVKVKTNHILEISGLENEKIKEIVYTKNFYKQGIYFVRVSTNSGYEIAFNAEDGTFWYFGKNSIAKDKTVGDKITKEEAKKAVLDYYSKCDFLLNKNFTLDTVKKSNHAQETSYKTVWEAEFKEKLDNGILNNFRYVAIYFDVVDGKIHVYFVRESETFNDVYNDKKFEVYNNDIVLTEKQAINKALEKDKSLTGNEVKKSYAFLSNKLMNNYIWIKEHKELTGEDLQGETEIDGQTYLYSKYYFEKNIIRNVYVVVVRYKVEENMCLESNNYATVYYVDATTGEIIGGEAYYNYTYRKGIDLYDKDYSVHTSKIVYYYDQYTNDYLGSYSINLPQEELDKFPNEVEWNSEEGNPFGYVN